MAFILAWALPVIILQAAIGWPALRRRWRLVLVAVGVPTLYLSCADALAISQGIWHISESKIVGVYFGPVPLEEVVFFLATNTMVVQAFILFRSPLAWARIRRLLRRKSGTPTPPPVALPGGKR